VIVLYPCKGLSDLPIGGVNETDHTFGDVT
jgi:hypothetical protein